jgi:cytidylate kinase
MTIIAMTREIGSRGTEVAAGLATALGLKIVDSEIVANQVGERLGLEENAVKRYVEGSASLFERWKMNERKLSRYTSEEILELCQQGNALIRGWGAAAVFRDVPRVISVRVCAPMAFRESVMMERLGVTDAEAIRQEIERYDAAYVSTMRNSFGCERDDALLYHIVLNMARMPVDAGVKTICELAGNPWFQDEASSRSALADKLLATRVSAALVEHVSISMAPAGVTVSAVDGRLTLSGMTSSGNLRAMAEQIAQGIAGVTEIDNRIISVPTQGTGI